MTNQIDAVEPPFNEHNPDPSETEQTVEITAQFIPRRHRAREFIVKSSLTFAGMIGVTALNNIEAIDAYRVYMRQGTAAAGDIIPDRTGCDELVIDQRADAGQPPATNDYNPDNDTVLAEVGDKISGVHRYGEPQVSDENAPTVLSPIMTPFESYFDRITARGQTEQGANIEVLRNHDGRAFAFDTSALDRMTSLIFDNPEIYTNPGVRAIIDCKRREVIEAGYFEGKDIMAMIAPGENTFIQNFSIGRYEDAIANRSHLAGFGSPNIRLNLQPFGDTPDNIMIITGINKNETRINQLVLHEWTHVLMFQDLSDALSEPDEQERFVRYVEETIVNYLADNKLDLPKVITLLGDDESAPDLGRADSLQLRAALYILYLAAGSMAVGALSAFGNKSKDPFKLEI